MLSAYLLPGVKIDNFITALILALVLAVLNLLVKPVLIILTLPVTIVTLGLFLLVINAIIILLASHLVSGFRVNGFWWALLFSIVMTIINSFMHGLAGSED
jgi:putative membrane protein